MQYRPTAVELLVALADSLERDVLPASEVTTQHTVRVAVNLARLVAREIALTDEADSAERVALVSLLGSDAPVVVLEEQLSAQLRAGALDDVRRDVWDALVAIARQDLAIAKPAYDHWDQG